MGRESCREVRDTLLWVSRKVISSQQDRRFPRAQRQLPALHPSPCMGPLAQALPSLGCCAGISPGWHIGTADVVSAWEGQIPKALAVQLGLQCREEGIYTREYNVRTNLGLQESVFTGAYCNSMSEIGFSVDLFPDRKDKVHGYQKSVLKSPPIASTTTQHRHLSCTVRSTPAPSDPCPNTQHGQLSLFKSKRGIWVTSELSQGTWHQSCPKGPSTLRREARTEILFLLSTSLPEDFH